MRFLTTACALSIVAAFALAPVDAAADTPALPELGAGAGDLTPIEAHRLGRAWLRLFRRQLPVPEQDPLLLDYLHHLSHRLAEHARLETKQLEIVLIDNPTMNAFAVPGGVIGAHSGLLLFTEHEGELATVLAHELAHLQQRHFARQRQKRQEQSLPTLLGILAGVALAATSGGEAGLAAIYATQAAALESQLRYSRRYELEADRASMAIIASAGMQPSLVPNTFERMLQRWRYQARPPEFLLTHPVTERRIAAARDAARHYPKPTAKNDGDRTLFELMRLRTRVLAGREPALVAALAKSVADKRADRTQRYGHALALATARQYDEALKVISPLLATRAPPIQFFYDAGDIAEKSGQYQKGLAIARKARRLYPDSYPLETLYGRLLGSAGFAEEALPTLRRLTRRHPYRPLPRRLLAHGLGLNGDIVGMHRAYAEYWALSGDLNKARQRLVYALRLAGKNPILIRGIRARLREFKILEAEQRSIR